MKKLGLVMIVAFYLSISTYANEKRTCTNKSMPTSEPEIVIENLVRSDLVLIQKFE